MERKFLTFRFGFCGLTLNNVTSSVWRDGDYDIILFLLTFSPYGANIENVGMNK